MIKDETSKFLKNKIHITTCLSKLVKELCILEINDKKDSNEYLITLNKIKSLTFLEDELYKDLNYMSYEQIEYSLNNSILKDSLSELSISNTLDIENDQLIKSRITKSIEYQSLNKRITSLIGSVNEHLIEYRKKEELYSIKQSLIEKKFFEQQEEINILRALDEEINNTKNKFLKSKLIIIKYKRAFIDKEIFNNLLSNNFDISSLDDQLTPAKPNNIEEEKSKRVDTILHKNIYDFVCSKKESKFDTLTKKIIIKGMIDTYATVEDLERICKYYLNIQILNTDNYKNKMINSLFDILGPKLIEKDIQLKKRLKD